MRRVDERIVQRRRRLGLILFVALLVVGITAYNQWSAVREASETKPTVSIPAGQELAVQALGKLAVRERVSREGYSRDQFGSGWASMNGCDTRNRILQRDLEETALDPSNNCTVLSGVLKMDTYTGKTIFFTRGPGTSNAIQIDHVVALSDAWQKGAQDLTPERRQQFANDPLNLLAVDGPANMEKSDSDAAEWLPPQKDYQCRYIARQVAVKIKYILWVTQVEFNAMKRTLQTCPNQVLPVEAGQ
jgi:hypothetical protein